MPRSSLKNIDLFAGCGGLSTVLHLSGWNGLLAVERNPATFSTLKANLVDGRKRLDWSSWPPVGPWDIKTQPKEIGRQLAQLKGSEDQVVGGPPCQGFSTADRRIEGDQRNQLVHSYHVKVFQRLLADAPRDRCIMGAAREHLGLRKRSVTVLDALEPAPTVTTIPDDFVHYSEPRVMTVRECARLQTFPDWFEFKAPPPPAENSASCNPRATSRSATPSPRSSPPSQVSHSRKLSVMANVKFRISAALKNVGGGEQASADVIANPRLETP